MSADGALAATVATLRASRDCVAALRKRLRLRNCQIKRDLFYGSDRTHSGIQWIVQPHAQLEGVCRVGGVKKIVIHGIDRNIFPSSAYVLVLVRPRIRRAYEVRLLAQANGACTLQVAREHRLTADAPRTTSAPASFQRGQPLIVEAFTARVAKGVTTSLC